ncbi:Acetamidase [Penicillium subrubescens]|uniref:Acetamidase n=1 Tax=Penicillium subrubescens TaxID=1316194 RepID=A0A1Q5UMW8_9EURO|nr:Acetamidase [Penicillium subrubescens]
MGYVSWLGKYDTTESVLVTLLRKAGAVFYTKTSVPQTLMVCETVNNIIGRTLNPRNKNWSCGGSSGGEGAMVGIRGGVIGVGTDIDINASGEPSIPNIKDLLNPDIQQIDMNQLWDTHLKKWNYQSEYLEKWRELEEQQGKELDAIIAPITATAAIRHNQFRYYGYASVINLLDFTSVVVPVTFADKNLDLKKKDYQPLGDLDATVQAEYDPEAYHGAPVAVQVIGRRLSEERTLAIAEEIGRLLGNSVTP